jgi:integrase
MTRRARGEGGLRWDEGRQRWIATKDIGYDGRGKRIVRKGTGRTQAEAKKRLKEVLRDYEDGLAVEAAKYTVKQAAEDWLTYGLGKQSAATAQKYRIICRVHIIPLLGARKLRDLTTREVEAWLLGRSKVLSTEFLHRTHACLNRAIRRAMAQDLVRRNVVDVAEVPRGRGGRPSKSLTPAQVDAVLTLTATDRLHNYLVLSLLTGARTEELRALRWEHVHLDQIGSVPAHIEVWRSVREDGDTKTRKSRRTLALPTRCVDALRKQRALQAAERLAAGERWRDTGLVFTTRFGTGIDAANVRRDFRRALALVPGLEAKEWTPRELRHSFVSVLSDAGIPVEEISQLVGHRGTTITELVYRHQLRPVIQTGATVMDRLFERGSSDA